MQIQAPIQLAMEILLIRHTSTDYHSNNFDCKMVTWQMPLPANPATYLAVR